MYGSTALVDFWRFSSFLAVLRKGSARRKAATYTQDITTTEYTHTDIHASSGIRNHEPSVRAGEDSYALEIVTTDRQGCK
jgi:hypothetical protein